MAPSARDRKAQHSERVYTDGMDMAYAQVMCLLIDAEHVAFFTNDSAAQTVLRDLIEAVGELDYGTIPDYDES